MCQRLMMDESERGRGSSIAGDLIHSIEEVEEV